MADAMFIIFDPVLVNRMSDVPAVIDNFNVPRFPDRYVAFIKGAAAPGEESSVSAEIIFCGEIFRIKRQRSLKMLHCSMMLSGLFHNDTEKIVRLRGNTSKAVRLV